MYFKWLYKELFNSTTNTTCYVHLQNFWHFIKNLKTLQTILMFTIMYDSLPVLPGLVALSYGITNKEHHLFQ